MTAIFHDMMYRELKDYMDDIVLKSRRREDHVKVLRKVFKRCWLFKLRMNPLKCAFRVSAGKFLGFQVHSKGIDVDLTKAMVIATMKPIATIRVFWEKFLTSAVHPWFSINHFSFYEITKERARLSVGRGTTRSFSKVTTDRDEPSRSTSSSSQEPIVTLCGLKPVCHWSFDSPRRWRRCQAASLLHKLRLKGCGDPLSQSGKGMPGNSLCITKTTPLFLVLRDTLDDKIPPD